MSYFSDTFKPPTKKWWASLTSGAVTILGSWVLTGAFDDVERGMAVTLATTLVASYWKSNDSTPTGDGVPA